MKIKLPIILMLLALIGCQQKSEVDKCVEAQATQICNQWTELDKGKSKRFYEIVTKGGTESECVVAMLKRTGGDLRKECLNAQSGNK